MKPVVDNSLLCFDIIPVFTLLILCPSPPFQWPIHKPILSYTMCLGSLAMNNISTKETSVFRRGHFPFDACQPKTWAHLQFRNKSISFYFLGSSSSLYHILFQILPHKQDSSLYLVIETIYKSLDIHGFREYTINVVVLISIDIHFYDDHIKCF